jgi:deoxycytidylate deaminase
MDSKCNAIKEKILSLGTSIALAMSSDIKCRICAICTDKRGNILSVGTNSYTKTHPTQKRYAEKVNLHLKEFVHAEIKALLALDRYTLPKAHALYICRVLKDGTASLAKPCMICSAAISDYNIKEVYYTQ